VIISTHVRTGPGPKKKQMKTLVAIGKAKDKCGKGSHKQQFYFKLPVELPGNVKMWMCGWYDEKTASWSAYHYTDFDKIRSKTEHGHKKEDGYLGVINSERVKKGDCQVEKSNAMAATASLLLWNVMAFL